VKTYMGQKSVRKGMGRKEQALEKLCPVGERTSKRGQIVQRGKREEPPRKGENSFTGGKKVEWGKRKKITKGKKPPLTRPGKSLH